MTGGEMMQSQARYASARGVMALIIFICGMLITQHARADEAEDFFKRVGRINMIVGSGAGGGYDQIARLLARHLARFLPGMPTISIENMPTAVGIQATNYLFNTAPRDGSVILADPNSALALPIYGSPNAHYDPRAFEWIGSLGKQTALCLTSKASGISSLDDARTRDVTVSATGVNAGPGVYPLIINQFLGTKLKVIAGYSTGTMPLAVDRGEVDGLCGYAWESYQANGSSWFSEHKVNILVQLGLTKLKNLPDVPLARDLLASDDDKAVLDLIVLPQEFGRPFIAPPHTPADRMKIYRYAFARVLEDPLFIAEAQQQRIIINALSADEIMVLLNKAYQAPPHIKERAAVFATQFN
jgi:tripartite-type tricarboxylate transporter receptor subunit TctC